MTDENNSAAPSADEENVKIYNPVKGSPKPYDAAETDEVKIYGNFSV